MSDLLRFSTSDPSNTPNNISNIVNNNSSGVPSNSVGNTVVLTSGGREESQTHHELINGEDLLKELEAVVERLKALYNDTKTSLTDDNIEVSRFCRCLETILRHGQKEKLSFWGERKDYFHYLTENISGLKSFDQIIKKVQSLTEIISGQGKGRALIRLCLSDQLLADCIQSSITNTKKTKDWYQFGAVLVTPSLTQRLISALYDLSDVTFTLPVDGLDLDETWPSFVQKSFSNSPKPGSGGGMSNLIKKALKTRDAKSIDKTPKQDYVLERAIEEEPSQIFIKHEIPFDLTLVGSLIDDIRTLLIDEFEGYSHLSNLPYLKVSQLDDISSGLSLLKDYISTMSSDVNRSMDKRKRLVHQLKHQLAKLESEVKEWKEKSGELEEELQMKDGDLTSSTHQLQLITEEKRKYWSQLLEQREQVSNLQIQISQLKEEKEILKTDSKINSEVSQLENELFIARQNASEINSLNSLLLVQLAANNESQNVLRNNLMTVTKHHQEEERKKSQEMSSLRDNLKSLEGMMISAQNELQLKDEHYKEFELLRTEEVTSLKEQLEVSLSVREELERERNVLRDEVTAMNGMVEQETASLRFQLSTSNMQLQQNSESSIKKDQELIDLKDQLQQLKEQLTQTRGVLYKKEGANEELLQQLAIAETRSQGLTEELKSLNEQLTEKTLNRDALREEYLRQEREWDDKKERMTKDIQRVNNHATKVLEENEHLRKALQRLLAQKVSLWQHADELEQEQVAKGVWLDSREVTECMSCQTPFTMFNRKHHCRSCGKVYCGTCCCHKAQLPSNRDPVRVCKDCYSRIKSLRTPQASSLVNTGLEETTTASTTISGGEGGGEVERSINSFPGGVALSATNNSLLLDGSDEPLLAHIKELTNHNKQESPRHSSVENSMEYCIQPMSNSHQQPLTYTVASTDKTTADPDDEFCVIEALSKSDVFPIGMDDSKLDVRALRAKLARLESDNSIEEKDGASSTPTVRRSPPDSFLKEESDLEVGGGMVHSVPVTVATPRTGVFWQFNSQPKGIAIGLNYQETQDNESAVEVLPLRRVMSHKAILTGEYVAQKAGVYTLVFSNTHSKYSGRVLSYKIWTKAPQ